MSDMADRDTCAGPHPRYKVALIGEPGVGKTSLLTRLKRGTFETTNTSTVGLDTVLLEVTTRSGTLVHVSGAIRAPMFALTSDRLVPGYDI